MQVVFIIFYILHIYTFYFLCIFTISFVSYLFFFITVTYSKKGIHTGTPFSIILLFCLDLPYFSQPSIQILHLKFLFQLPALILLDNICPLIIELLSPGKADLHLYQTSLKVYLKRNQGITLFRNLSIQL